MLLFRHKHRTNVRFLNNLSHDNQKKLTFCSQISLKKTIDFFNKKIIMKPQFKTPHRRGSSSITASTISGVSAGAVNRISVTRLFAASFIVAVAEGLFLFFKKERR